MMYNWYKVCKHIQNALDKVFPCTVPDKTSECGPVSSDNYEKKEHVDEVKCFEFGQDGGSGCAQAYKGEDERV
jgi:hypothetical protein